MKPPLFPHVLLSVFTLLSSTVHAQPLVVAYVPNWTDLAAFSREIDYAKLTHINLAFENPVDADGALSFQPANKALISQAKAHHVKILVSIGGGSASEDKKMRKRYFDLISDAKRTAFVTRLAAYVSEHDFDGLDVDLEGPAINKDYGAFIQSLAAALKPKGRLLTAALSQGYGGKDVPDAALEHFDFINLMAYDATGPWEPKAPGPHSSLEFAKSTVDHWLKRGLPKTKAVLGVPFYGWGFGKAFRQEEYRYADLLAQHPGAENTDHIGDTIWFNGLPTIQAKAKLVRDEQLAGMMIWSLDSDAKGGHSLLSAIHAALNQEKP